MKPEDLRVSAEQQRGAVSLEWLGTAGFRLTHEGFTLLIDPYFSRLSLAQCLLGRARADEDLLARKAPQAHAVLVGHSHFDHVLDVPAIARRTGAQVYGSQSTVNLCLSAGLAPEQLTALSPGQVFEAGPFRVRVLAGEHGRIWRGRVPWAGEIACCSDLPGRIGDYRCGQVLWFHLTVAGRSFFHHGSAELAPDTPVLPTDHLLACVAGWHKAQSLGQRLLHHTQPGRVWLCHYDNFFLPFGRGDVALPAVKLGGYVETLQAQDRQVAVNTLPLLAPVWL